MVTRNDSVWKTLDWVTIGIYLLLIVAGWFSVCGASYDYSDRDFLDFSTRAGKQFVWIICSFGLGFVLLMLEDRMYDMFAYLLYVGFVVLLFITPFVAEDIKGSYSWIKLGPVNLQPAEFAKFATALALAKYMNAYSFSIKREKCAFMLGVIILLPMLLIVAQRETGSALVYISFFLVLYREGMPGVVLFAGGYPIQRGVYCRHSDSVGRIYRPVSHPDVCRRYGVGIQKEDCAHADYYGGNDTGIAAGLPGF